MSVPSEEQWRPVAGQDGYEVSDQGRVRSLTRTILRSNGSPLTLRGKTLRPWPDGKGYSSVYLGRGNAHRIHRLVLEAFLGPCREGLEARHRDGDRTNPALVNLAYGTRSENSHDKRAHGTDPNVAKTRCPQNHPYNEANTRNYRGRRYCKACKRDRAQSGTRAVQMIS